MKVSSVKNNERPKVANTNQGRRNVSNFGGPAKLYISSTLNINLYTVAHTIDCVCSKMLNHGFFLSLLKLIPGRYGILIFSCQLFVLFEKICSIKSCHFSKSRNPDGKGKPDIFLKNT